MLCFCRTVNDISPLYSHWEYQVTIGTAASESKQCTTRKLNRGGVAIRPILVMAGQKTHVAAKPLADRKHIWCPNMWSTCNIGSDAYGS